MSYKLFNNTKYKNNLLKPVSLLESKIYVNKNKEKYLLLNLRNNFESVLNELTINVTEYNANNEVLRVSKYSYSNLNVESSTNFIPYSKIALTSKTNSVTVEILTSIFNDNNELANKMKDEASNFKEDDLVSKTKTKTLSLKKNYLSIIFGAILILLVTGFISLNANTSYKNIIKQKGLFEYSVLKDNEDKIIITKYNGRSNNVIIEQFIDSKEVIAIAEYAFADNKNIKSLSINANNIEIRKYAFRNATNLRSIYASGNIENIGVSAFANNTKLKKITAANIVKIEHFAFYNTKSLTDIFTRDFSKTEYESNSFLLSYYQNILDEKNKK